MEIRRLKTLIEDKIQHSYLEKYIQKPVIDEEKLIILAAIINNTTLSALKKEQYIITTMLVQIALDTHELVPKLNEPDESKEFELTKQLSVLAGDYFSGLYYFLLSEIEDFDLIHTLASAIKEINEYKMKLYYNEVNALHNYIDIVGKIESLLILRVANFVNDHAIQSITGEWLIINTLIKEKEKINRNGFSPLLTKWVHTNDTYSSVLNTVDLIIKSNAIHIDQVLVKLSVHQTAFKAHVNAKLKTLMFNNTSIAEEG